MMWFVDNSPTTNFQVTVGYGTTTITSYVAAEPEWWTETPRDRARRELAALQQELRDKLERFGRHAIRIGRLLLLWRERLRAELAERFSQGVREPCLPVRTRQLRSGRVCALSSAWRSIRAPP